MTEPPPLIPYPAIEQHGVIGDRRTAALVAADGAIDWLCLPNYDGSIVYGALLDVERGGFWRIGPAQLSTGRQRYLDESAVLVTTWETGSGVVELTDALAWPESERASADDERRVVLRRLRVWPCLVIRRRRNGIWTG